MKANRIRFTGIAFAAILALGGFSARAASKDELLRIAADRPVPGWSVMADSTTYVQGDGLTQIYNGGYEVYTKAGVADAVRRIYMQGEDYVEVTVHGMKSSQSAKDFLADRHRMEMGRSAPATAGWNSFFRLPHGRHDGLCSRGPFFHDDRGLFRRG